MVELQASPPCAGHRPFETGGMRLAEVDLGPLTSIAPYRGKTRDLSKRLKAAHGLEWPAPGQSHNAPTGNIIWFGREMALLVGLPPAEGLETCAALTDQSDAWACVELSGARCEDVLARLVPVDLRVPHFPQGATARTLLGHMNASITRIAPDGFHILVFRSMAGTLWHELQSAMESVAARG